MKITDELMSRKIDLYFISNAEEKFDTVSDLIEYIQLYLKQFTGLEKSNAAYKIIDLIRLYKTEHAVKVEKLQQALSNMNSLGWKAACFSQYTTAIYRDYFHAITPGINAKHQILFDKSRFCNVESILKNVPPESGYAIVGSTFTSNKPQFQQIENESHILDAMCVANHLDNKGNVDGLMVALGDGCGGHFGDKPQDKTIARSAHFASKQAIRVLSLFDHPDEILSAMNEIVLIIKKELIQKSPMENTTLLCARVFAEEEGYRIVGFNIGDGLLAVWNAEKKSIETIAPSIVTEKGVAQFPYAFKPHEVHVFDQHISLGSHLCIFSDGIVDGLPTLKQKKQYANQLLYHEAIIDAKLFNPILENMHNAQTRTECLVRHVVSTIEAQRQTLLTGTQLEQYGDDIAIAFLDLSLITPKLRNTAKCVIN
ncbi:MAG: hypothetical protein WC748_08100 [Legionellales bacterium]|jgi:hypothetical protein